MPPPIDTVAPIRDVTEVSRLTLDYQVGVYFQDDERTRYWQRSGNLMVPVAAADGAPQEVIKQHAACGGKLVCFAVARFGLMPLVPGVEKSDPNVIYLGGEVWVDKPAVGMEGTPYYYRVEGYYLYGFKVPVWVDTASGLPVGAKVTDRTSPEKNVIPVTAFVDGGKKFPPNNAPGDLPNVINALKPAPPQTTGKAITTVSLGPNITRSAP